jgi:hypothetical protein
MFFYSAAIRLYTFELRMKLTNIYIEIYVVEFTTKYTYIYTYIQESATKFYINIFLTFAPCI